MHVIAGKARELRGRQHPEFKDRMQHARRCQDPCRTTTGRRRQGQRRLRVTGGTNVHLVMVDLRNSEMDGQQGEDLLAACGITINRNTVPFDPRPASVASA